MNLDDIATWCGKYWPVVVSVVSVAAGGSATWKNVLDIRRGQREEAAKRAAALRDEEYRRWTDGKLKEVRAPGPDGSSVPVYVSPDDRGALEWAVRNERLRVMRWMQDGTCQVVEAMPK